MRIILAKTKQGPKLTIKFNSRELTDNLYPELFDYLKGQLGFSDKDLGKKISIAPNMFIPLEPLSLEDGKPSKPIIDVLAILEANANQLRKHKHEFKIKKGFFPVTTNNIEGFINYALRRERGQQSNTFFEYPDFEHYSQQQRNLLITKISNHTSIVSKKFQKFTSLFKEIDSDHNFIKPKYDAPEEPHYIVLTEKISQLWEGFQKANADFGSLKVSDLKKCSTDTLSNLNYLVHNTADKISVLHQHGENIKEFSQTAVALQDSLHLANEVSSLLIETNSNIPQNKKLISAAHTAQIRVKKEMASAIAEINVSDKKKSPSFTTRIKQWVQTFLSHNSNLSLLKRQKDEEYAELQKPGLKKQILQLKNDISEKFTFLTSEFVQIKAKYSSLINDELGNTINTGKLTNKISNLGQRVEEGKQAVQYSTKIEFDNLGLIQLRELYDQLCKVSLEIDISLGKYSDIAATVKSLECIKLSITPLQQTLTQKETSETANFKEVLTEYRTIALKLIDKTLLDEKYVSSNDTQAIKAQKHKKARISPNFFTPPSEIELSLNKELDQKCSQDIPEELKISHQDWKITRGLRYLLMNEASETTLIADDMETLNSRAPKPLT